MPVDTKLRAKFQRACYIITKRSSDLHIENQSLRQAYRRKDFEASMGNVGAAELVGHEV
jgi:hypothetical protein